MKKTDKVMPKWLVSGSILIVVLLLAFLSPALNVKFYGKKRKPASERSESSVVDQGDSVYEIWEKNKKEHTDLTVAREQTLKEIRALSSVEKAGIHGAEEFRVWVVFKTGLNFSFCTGKEWTGLRD